MNEVGCNRLRYAVVRMAATDYLAALRYIRSNPVSEDAPRNHWRYDEMQYQALECERFFRREIGYYMDIDGEYLIQRLKDMSKTKGSRINGLMMGGF